MRNLSHHNSVLRQALKNIFLAGHCWKSSLLRNHDVLYFYQRNKNSIYFVLCIVNALLKIGTLMINCKSCLVQCEELTKNLGFKTTKPGLSHFMILRYLLYSLLSRMFLPMQAENILFALGEPAVKRDRTTNNAKP